MTDNFATMHENRTDWDAAFAHSLLGFYIDIIRGQLNTGWRAQSVKECSICKKFEQEVAELEEMVTRTESAGGVYKEDGLRFQVELKQKNERWALHQRSPECTTTK